MPTIRNLELIKKFTDYFRLKFTDSLDTEAGRMLVPVVSIPVPLNVIEISDLSENDSNKSRTVPPGKQWKIIYGTIRLITTATVGDRQFEFRVENSLGGFLYVVRAAAVQAASLTELYTLGQFGNVAQTVDGRHTIPIPNDLILKEGFIITILDTAAVDASADDLSIRIVIEETEVTGE